MSKIIVESGIPIPAKRKSVEPYYPFGIMDVGDSFFIPDVPKNFSVHGAVRTYNEKHFPPIKIVQRRHGNGVRVWRIA